MPLSAQQTTVLILQALRPDQEGKGWLAAAEAAGIDWNDLSVRAIVLGLAPQLHHRLAGWALPLPPLPAARLALNFQAQEKRNAAIYEQLGELLAACARRGLHPIALKGVHLAALVYPAPALRPMNDIDLLFSPGELPAAEALLAELGYGGKYKSAALGPGVTKHTSTFRRQGNQPATPNPYLSPEGQRTVEPHSSLEESWFGLKVDITPGVRQRAVPATLGGQPCLVLSPEDLLLHVAVHFCFHLIMGAPNLVQLADLLAITQRLPLDWAAVAERAAARRAAPYTLAALSLGQKLLGAEMPASTRQTLARATPAPLRRRIARLGLADLLRRSQQKPLRTLGQRLRRGLGDRAETARWAPGWRGRWQVWQTALAFSRTDTGRLLLGRR